MFSSSVGGQNNRIKTGTQVFFFLVFLTCLWAPVEAYDYQLDVEYWNFSFLGPSRQYGFVMTERKEDGEASLGYQLTNRFRYWDNTFTIGWSQKEKKWSWSLEAAWTPHASVSARHTESLIFYLPPVWAGMEPLAGAAFSRYNEARVASGLLGLRQALGHHGDALARWNRNRITGLSPQGSVPVSQQLWSNAFHLEVGWRLGQARFYGWRAQSKEFFESGSPLPPREFTAQEQGAGIMLQARGGSLLHLSHALQERSDTTSVRKWRAGYSHFFGE